MRAFNTLIRKKTLNPQIHKYSKNSLCSRKNLNNHWTCDNRRDSKFHERSSTRQYNHRQLLFQSQKLHHFLFSHEYEVADYAWWRQTFWTICEHSSFPLSHMGHWHEGHIHWKHSSWYAIHKTWSSEDNSQRQAILFPDLIRSFTTRVNTRNYERSQSHDHMQKKEATIQAVVSAS